MNSAEMVIYGTGEGGRITAGFVEKLGWSVLSFCDPDSDKWGTDFCGKKVISPDELERMGPDTPVLVASAQGEAVCKSLRKRGLERIINPQIHKQLIEVRPKVLEISTGIGCKVDCRFCCQKTIVREYSRRSHQYMMSMETFERCLETVPAEVKIHFCGLYEPFLNDLCAAMMLHAHHKGHDVWFASTLVNMTMADWNSISGIPFKVVIIHLADAEGHSHIPVTEEYKDVLKSVVETISRGPDDGIRFFHCHGHLHPEVEEIIRECDWPRSFAIHDRAGHEKDDSLHGRHVFGEIYCHHNGTRFQYNLLFPDGRVGLCHCDCTLSYILGNLLEQDYASLFASPLIEELREKSKTHDCDILCRACQDARQADGGNFPVWNVYEWEPFYWYSRGLVF